MIHSKIDYKTTNNKEAVAYALSCAASLHSPGGKIKASKMRHLKKLVKYYHRSRNGK
jgi:hypothetical protein